MCLSALLDLLSRARHCFVRKRPPAPRPPAHGFRPLHPHAQRSARRDSPACGLLAETPRGAGAEELPPRCTEGNLVVKRVLVRSASEDSAASRPSSSFTPLSSPASLKGRLATVWRTRCTSLYDLYALDDSTRAGMVPDVLDGVSLANLEGREQRRLLTARLLGALLGAYAAAPPAITLPPYPWSPLPSPAFDAFALERADALPRPPLPPALAGLPPLQAALAAWLFESARGLMCWYIGSLRAAGLFEAAAGEELAGLAALGAFIAYGILAPAAFRALPAPPGTPLAALLLPDAGPPPAPGPPACEVDPARPWAATGADGSTSVQGYGARMLFRAWKAGGLAYGKLFCRLSFERSPELR